ncbi:RNA polymerase sigma-70 factor [Zhouia spongiae]|uniref:RNA polymerase sigma-70 factor n=1 Tax=Zhouia spongiae TaxID=2202721 RepID=A0ABY3YL67_9FLAO|nr:RNA polymerase sigma-70 factor [Zhouia spongiae]UNY98539.1 RNA polymerase sigma-70 factor [Zhouia spongiae]
MKSIEDEKLLEDLKQDKREALTKLYRMYWDMLFISSYNILKDKEACEEIIQDTFINLWRNRKKLNVQVSFKSYLYASVRYQVFRFIKKRKETFLFEDEVGLENRFQYQSPENELIYEELVKQINSIVEKLPEKCKQVYLLSRNEQLSHKEIAASLKISTKTVENHITKALTILRGSLAIEAISIIMITILINNYLK